MTTPAKPASGTPAPASGFPAVPRPIIVLFLLFVFLVGVKGLGDGFKDLGRDFLQSFFGATANPFIGLIVGLLATTLVQSSSVTTAMIVGLVAAPTDPLPLANAIPMIMGANIGTTVTNTLVSMAHMGRRDEFRRAFAAATCHDFFNFVTVAILLPFELLTGYLRKTATFVATHVGHIGGTEYESPLKHALSAAFAPIKATADALFTGWGHAVFLIVVSGVLIYVALILVVRVMRATMEQRVESFLIRALDKSVLLSLLIGAVATVMVQSSSITTSLLVPLAGAGLMTLRQIFPITVGANIGTTVTALLASLAVSGPNATAGLTIALVHLLFNVTGSALILPVPFMRNIPLSAARGLANVATRSRRWAVIYVIVLFYLIPAALVVISRALS
ncbi:MAG: Na/Pi symporter [Gemmatimonadota bacterium]|nr:Na/Pi symporter [Gemmatimonadota bacterium]